MAAQVFVRQSAWIDEAKRLAQLAAPAAGIFASIGILVAAWAAAGVIPLLIVKGLELVSVQFFLIGAALASAALAFATGTSWGTVATLGVALMGVARGLGLDPSAAAGAIFAGAHVGDKLSPLSETATLSATVAGTKLYTHLQHTALTTLPAFALTALVYLILPGGHGTGVGQPEAARQLEAAVAQHFVLSPWLWLPVAVVLAAALLRWPVVPSLLASGVLALVLAVVLQGLPWSELPALLWFGNRPDTGDAQLNALLTQGGLWPMVKLAMAAAGLLVLVAVALRSRPGRNAMAWVGRAASTPFRAVAVTVALCLALIFASGSTYLTILMTGQLLLPAYRALGLAPQNLSRTLEDTATEMAGLVPWGVSGIYMARTLGVSTLAFAPYALANFLGIGLALLYAYTGWFLPREPVNKGEAGRSSGR